MGQRLAGKKVVITAAGQGIGRAAAIACAAEGASVVATDINSESLTQLVSAHRQLATAVLDVTDRMAIQAFSEKVGDIDVLFNCVGHVFHGTILETTPEEWERSFQINVTSMYDMARTFLPGMLTAGRGNIINMSSACSSVLGAPNRCAYGATKAAVIGLTKSIAADFVKQGIRCNAICPGTVQSPSLEERIRSQNNDEAARQAFLDRQPLGRLGRPEEIASLVVYLASDESEFVTGGVQIIDGGWSSF